MTFWLSEISYDSILGLYLVLFAGWTESSVLLVAGATHLLVSLLEIPTGVLADLYGKIKVTRIGMLILAFAFLKLHHLN